VGSNPITSTESPGHRADGGIPEKPALPDKGPACLYVSLSPNVVAPATNPHLPNDGLAIPRPVASGRSKTSLTAVDPSPTAAATCLTDRLRASPTQNTPGLLVSNAKGDLSTSSSWDRGMNGDVRMVSMDAGPTTGCGWRAP
jgi:hypothetical protein